jgi:hypothetical protein
MIGLGWIELVIIAVVGLILLGGAVALVVAILAAASRGRDERH